MTILNDDVFWADSTSEQLEDTARRWAKKYTTKKLFSFQSFYTNMQQKETSDICWKAFENRLKCVEFAIRVKEFGE